MSINLIVIPSKNDNDKVLNKLSNEMERAKKDKKKFVAFVHLPEKDSSIMSLDIIDKETSKGGLAGCFLSEMVKELLYGEESNFNEIHIIVPIDSSFNKLRKLKKIFESNNNSATSWLNDEKWIFSDIRLGKPYKYSARLHKGPNKDTQIPITITFIVATNLTVKSISEMCKKIGYEVRIKEKESDSLARKGSSFKTLPEIDIIEDEKDSASSNVSSTAVALSTASPAAAAVGAAAQSSAVAGAASDLTSGSSGEAPAISGQPSSVSGKKRGQARSFLKSVTFSPDPGSQLVLGPQSGSATGPAVDPTRRQNNKEIGFWSRLWNMYGGQHEMRTFVGFILSMLVMSFLLTTPGGHAILAALLLPHLAASFAALAIGFKIAFLAVPLIVGSPLIRLVGEVLQLVGRWCLDVLLRPGLFFGALLFAYGNKNLEEGGSSLVKGLSYVLVVVGFVITLPFVLLNVLGEGVNWLGEKLQGLTARNEDPDLIPLGGARQAFRVLKQETVAKGSRDGVLWYYTLGFLDTPVSKSYEEYKRVKEEDNSNPVDNGNGDVVPNP